MDIVGGCYGRYLLLPPPDRLPSLKARYHFLLAQAETGVPRISPVSNQGAPMEPVQLITSQGTVTARYNNKKEPTPQVTALPGISTYWPLPLVSCRAMKPGAIPTASAVNNNHSRKVNCVPSFSGNVSSGGIIDLWTNKLQKLLESLADSPRDWSRDGVWIIANYKI